MKTRLLLITLFLILGLLVIYVVTIPKSYTWNYELPNEYFIKKESDTRIILGLNDEIKVEYENCLECGACRMICPNNAIEWQYPKSSKGVIYKLS